MKTVQYVSPVHGTKRVFHITWGFEKAVAIAYDY